MVAVAESLLGRCRICVDLSLNVLTQKLYCVVEKFRGLELKRSDSKIVFGSTSPRSGTTSLAA